MYEYKAYVCLQTKHPTIEFSSMQTKAHANDVAAILIC